MLPKNLAILNFLDFEKVSRFIENFTAQPRVQ